MIKMQVIGNLGKDCVVNTVNGKNVINFTVAHTEKYKDSQGNQQEKTTWVDCAYWTDRTAVAPYLTKGKQVYVEGQPEVRSFTRQDGTAGSSLSMRVRELQLIGGSRNENEGGGGGYGGQQSYGQQQQSAPQRQGAPAADDMADDLPF
ncbi:MAG: single-stranded DNA-binding protein [Chitinophagaceae bacterium]|nr:MAG: single-stranded DNA-binding protein [Chitinophagaceae bacterium]